MNESKKDNATALIVILGVALGAYLFFGVLLPDIRSTADERTVDELPRYVTYSVTGSGSRASLTISNEGGNTEQHDVTLPWSRAFYAEPGFTIYVGARSDDDASRVIRCEISVDGRVVEEAEGSGRFVGVTCSGSVP